MVKEELAKKFDIDLKKLEKEQKKLAKQLHLKDKIDFKLADRIASIENGFYKNKIVSGIIVVNPKMEILHQEYFSGNLRFPYISGFRAYRELPSMTEAFHKLDEKPDVIFVHGNGLLHPRLGLASHFSLVTQTPVVGVTDSLLAGEEKGNDVLLNGKVAGKILHSKKGSKPLYISPGNFISIKTALELTNKFIIPPHKFPEPMHLARKYVKDIKNELFKR